MRIAEDRPGEGVKPIGVEMLDDLRRDGGVPPFEAPVAIGQ